MEVSPFYTYVPKITIIRCTVSEIWNETEFFIILGHFLTFFPMDPENQNFGKMKNKPADIIILQMCTINDGHMMHGF